MWYSLIRHVLFCLPAEFSHAIALRGLRWLARCRLLRFFVRTPKQSHITVKSLAPTNRVGLAGGLDKNGDYIDAMLALGFGFVEVGTVTPRPQRGNPKPRLFRLRRDRALINRMGFNNKGVDYCVQRLQRRRLPGVVGVNIGKNKETPLSQAHEDYLTCLTRVFPYADYIVINISSPNTPGLRDLGQEEALSTLLSRLSTEMDALATQWQRRPLWLLKISVDIAETFLPTLVSLVVAHRVDGIISSNTTLDRSGLRSPEREQAGGLSGQPLTSRALAQLTLLRQLAPDLLLVSVGGIMQAADAKARFAAGADLIQLYTGFIYGGPGIIRACQPAGSA